jgi:hypothetical protein
MHHEFVRSIPAKLEKDILYISIDYKTTIHLCPCGCESEVVNPLSPAGWQLNFNGETISLRPSIGNWSLPCRSHYFITNDKVRWAESFNDKEIAITKQRDKDSVKELHESLDSNKTSNFYIQIKDFFSRFMR